MAMSKGMKWFWGVVVLVIIVVLVLWWAGVFNTSTSAPAAQQGAAASTAVSAGTDSSLSDSSIDTSVATIDAQIKVLATSIPAGAGTKTQIMAAAKNVQTVATLLSKLSIILQARASNAKTAGMSVTGVQASLTDLMHQVANATSQAGSASKNSSATTTSSATLSQSVVQLQTAQSDIKAARSDVASILTTLGVK